MSHKNLGLIGSAVLTFIGYKRTDTQTDKHQDKPNLYIRILILSSNICEMVEMIKILNILKKELNGISSIQISSQLKGI